MDCVREENKGLRQWLTPAGAVETNSKLIITYAITALCAFVFILEWIPGLEIVQNLAYAPVLTESEPYRMLTALFVHSQGFPLHILLNMYSLWILGRMLEPAFGKVRFLALFLVSGLAGSVAVLWLSDPLTAVVGASGAIFGLFAALLIYQLKVKGDVRSILALLVLNLVISFVGSGISWQAHLGGLISGALVAVAYLYVPVTKARNGLQIGATAVILVALVALSLVRVGQLHPLYQQLVGSLG